MNSFDSIVCLNTSIRPFLYFKFSKYPFIGILCLNFRKAVWMRILYLILFGFGIVGQFYGAGQF